MNLSERPKAFTNGHLKTILEKLFDGFKDAKSLLASTQEHNFLTYAHQRFLTQYCQERLYMTQKYDMAGLMLARKNP